MNDIAQQTDRNIWTVFVTPEKVFKYLAITILILLILNIGNIIIQYKISVAPWKAEFVDRYFNFNRENTLPAFFSTLLLLFASVMLFIISAVRKRMPQERWEKQWLILGAIFAFLAIDENIQIHESLSAYARGYFVTDDDSGLLYYAWVIPYFIFFLAVAVYLFKFVLALAPKTRNLFFLSAFLFVVGAIGFEMLEGLVYKLYEEKHNAGGHIYNEVLYCIEELLEMTGVTVFIYALLDYLNNYGSVIVISPRNLESDKLAQGQRYE